MNISCLCGLHIWIEHRIVVANYCTYIIRECNFCGRREFRMEVDLTVASNFEAIVQRTWKFIAWVPKGQRV